MENPLDRTATVAERCRAPERPGHEGYRRPFAAVNGGGGRYDGPMTLSRTPRRIVHWPDPVLLRKAAPVPSVDASIRELVDEMVRVMREEEGAGLAAPQVGASLRIFVVEAREARDGDPALPLGVYVNPRFERLEGGVEPMEEGCLSLPGIEVEVRRPPFAAIVATDLEGREFRLESSAVLARIWQHEYDHLEGTLIVDRMGPLDRIANRRAIKALREAAEA